MPMPNEQDEKAMIEKENAELRAMGVIDEEDTTSRNSEKYSDKKVKKMISGSQLLLKVVSSMNDMQTIEKVKFFMCK